MNKIEAFLEKAPHLAGCTHAGDDGTLYAEACTCGLTAALLEAQSYHVTYRDERVETTTDVDAFCAALVRHGATNRTAESVEVVAARGLDEAERAAFDAAMAKHRMRQRTREALAAQERWLREAEKDYEAIKDDLTEEARLRRRDEINNYVSEIRALREELAKP